MHFLDASQTKSYKELGYAGPFDLLHVSAAISLTKVLSRAKSRMFFWDRLLSKVPFMSTCFFISRWGAAKSKKGLHAVSNEAYCLGADRRIVDRVSQILGPDVLLGSSMLINQRPGASHYWHYDIEASEWNGLTVWVALANVSEKGTLRIITRSHLISFPPPIGLNDEEILAEAQRQDAACQHLVLHTQPGRFFILARHLWHSSWNGSSTTRYAMVFHYCRTDARVRWPPREVMHMTKLPIDSAYQIPCCLVNGQDHTQENLLLKRSS